jgi:hypothetical protein
MAISRDRGRRHLLTSLLLLLQVPGFFLDFSNTSFATLESQRQHRALLTARRQGMQEEDGAELFKDLCFISFHKDVSVRAGFR